MKESPARIRLLGWVIFSNDQKTKLGSGEAQVKPGADTL